MDDYSDPMEIDVLLSVASYYDDKCFCDCANCLESYKPVCIYCTPVLSLDAYEHFVYVASVGSTTTNSCCMDHIENLHRYRRCCYHFLVASCVSGVVLRSSDDLTTSNKDDVLAQFVFFFIFYVCAHTITTVYLF